ncbi:hypothetical protein HYV11_00165 [Candidatus Dependentiae bacterium]|nr:hypothetical protein [Candidatus Dependentiae bacterium]
MSQKNKTFLANFFDTALSKLTALYIGKGPAEELMKLKDRYYDEKLNSEQLKESFEKFVEEIEKVEDNTFLTDEKKALIKNIFIPAITVLSIYENLASQNVSIVVFTVVDIAALVISSSN